MLKACSKPSFLSILLLHKLTYQHYTGQASNLQEFFRKEGGILYFHVTVYALQMPIIVAFQTLKTGQAVLATADPCRLWQHTGRHHRYERSDLCVVFGGVLPDSAPLGWKACSPTMHHSHCVKPSRVGMPVPQRHHDGSASGCNGFPLWF